ncbi:MAG: DNA recombination protein RmuC [Alistipes shahii]|uniref:DNA recombination protein RmuC n=1 Tax=Alistipes shahii TaxID=328814 RepID=UPI00399CB679
MTLSLLFLLTTCCLTAVLVFVLLLWRRESRRLADAEARERDAATRLSAAEARLAASEQTAAAEKESLRRSEEQVRSLTEQRSRAEAELAAPRAAHPKPRSPPCGAGTPRNAKPRVRSAKRPKNVSGRSSGTWRRRFWASRPSTSKQTSKESIDILLKPFKDNIVDFRKRVEEIYTTQTSQRGELKAELKRLMELNQNISAEARNLTDALKGNSKVQGDWGEMLLETILDSSALSKGIHYETQYNIKDEEGRNLRPDVVLHLPEKKEIVIDSKVSLTAFVAYTSADTEEERRRHLAAHVASVRQHVTELGRKEYQRRLNSPDFVIMFVPNEPAFLAALQNDPAIWSDAYDKKVIVSSPTNLFALLKLVADLWKYNDQDKNTKEIAACGLKLYEQLVAFTGSLESVGTALDKARDAYEDAHKRLCTGNDNIIRVGERLRRTARLQTKRQHAARTLEIAGSDSEEELPEEPSARPDPAE